MPDLLYFVWGVLPFALGVMTLHTATKSVLKAGKRDYPKHYFKEFVFTCIMLCISIYLDKNLLAEDSALRIFIESFGLDYRIVRWLIYPAIITIGAMINQHFINKRVKAENAEKLARRMKYAPKN